MTKKGDGKYLPKPRRGPLGRASLRIAVSLREPRQSVADKSARAREQPQAKPAPVQFFWAPTTQKGYLFRYPFCVVGTVRLELMTSCMSSMRSNQLSYAPAYSMRHRFRKFSLIIIPFFKADCQSKTPHFLTFLCLGLKNFVVRGAGGEA